MKKMKMKMKLKNIVMLVLLIFVLLLWVNVFIVHGMFGVISWTLLKLILAPVGVLAMAIITILILVQLIRKKKITQSLLWLIVAMVYGFPLLLLVNVVPMKYPVKIESVLPAITIHSPFKVPVLVGWGGDSVENNMPHVIWGSERWAYDLVIEPKGVNSPNLVDYGIYEQDVYSPITGVVVAAFDSEEDILPNTDEFISMEGNHVYIKINETGTYLLLNHLKKDSVNVEVGSKVLVGDYIGKIGNSGSTSEPHLHIHHQRQDPTQTMSPILAEGLPLFFYDDSESMMPVKGEVINP